MADDAVISAPDLKSIYELPLNFEKDGLGDFITKKFGMGVIKPDLKKWREFVNKEKRANEVVKIGIVGKYFSTGNFVLTDSYISVIEAIKQASFYNNRKPEIVWIDADDYEKNPKKLKELKELDGVIVPGGFGSRAVEGKIAAIKYCRENKIPYLGLCYGMQLVVVEFARNVIGLKDAHTTEIDKKTTNPVIDILPEQKENIVNKRYGATMRLGLYTAHLKKGTIVHGAYKRSEVSERHRHRYEVNPEYIEILEKKGLVFSGFSPDRRLMEYVELPKKDHPFFVATQAHPEFLARPLSPHPLFVEFIKVAGKK